MEREPQRPRSVLLDGNDSPWYGFFFIQGLAEKLFQTPMGALAELSQEFLIESKIGPQHLRDSEDILPMG